MKTRQPLGLCVGGHRGGYDAQVVSPEPEKVVSRWYRALYMSIQSIFMEKDLRYRDWVFTSLRSDTYIRVLIIFQIKKTCIWLPLEITSKWNSFSQFLIKLLNEITFVGLKQIMGSSLITHDMYKLTTY